MSLLNIKIQILVGVWNEISLFLVKLTGELFLILKILLWKNKYFRNKFPFWSTQITFLLLSSKLYFSHQKKCSTFCLKHFTFAEEAVDYEKIIFPLALKLFASTEISWIFLLLKVEEDEISEFKSFRKKSQMVEKRWKFVKKNSDGPNSETQNF